MTANTNLDVMSLTELEVHANELFDIWQDVACNYATAANCGDDEDAIAELAREDAIAETAYDEAFTLLQVRTYEMLQNAKNSKRHLNLTHPARTPQPNPTP